MINCFIPFLSLPQARQTVRALGLCDRVKNIYLLATEKIPDEVEGCELPFWLVCANYDTLFLHHSQDVAKRQGLNCSISRGDGLGENLQSYTESWIIPNL